MFRLQHDTAIHAVASSKPAVPTKLQTQGPSMDALLQTLLRPSTSTLRCLGEACSEMLAPEAPAAPTLSKTDSRASKTVAPETSAGGTEANVQLTCAKRSLCAWKPPGRLPYRLFPVITWLILSCEVYYYSETPNSVRAVPTRSSSGTVPSPCSPQYLKHCGDPEGTGRCCKRQPKTHSLFYTSPPRWEETHAGETSATRSMEVATSKIFPTASIHVLSTVIQLSVGTLSCGVGPRSSLRVVTCVPVVVSVAASLLLQANGADVLVPAGRTAIGRTKGGAANGPVATVGAAGTEGTVGAPSAAGPAVNEAAGGGGRREKKGGGGGEAAKAGGHNEVVARGAGDGTAAVVAAAGTSVTTQEEGFARDSYWARSLRRRWGEQEYLDLVARTINGLESEDFWLAMLGKQLQLQSSKMHLRTQRIERHKVEQRRKKQAMAAFNQAQGKAEAAEAEFQRQRRGGGGAAGVAAGDLSNALQAGGAAGAVPGPRLYTGAGGGAKNEAELRFGELSLYTFDWVGPRTCAQLGWAAGNDVCALSLEIEIHVLHSRLLLKSVEVQDRQNRLFVCDTGAAFFRASAAALAKQEGSERQFYNAGTGSRNGKNCVGCDNRTAESTVGSTTTITVRGRGKSRDVKVGTPRSPHTATTGVASIGAMPDAPLAFWDDQGGNVEWTHGGGSRVGVTGTVGMGGSKGRHTTGMGTDKRRANRPPAGGGAGAAGPHTVSSPSPGRPQATAGERGGKKGQQQQHHGGGADVEEKHQQHHVFPPGGEDGSAAGGERRTGGARKKRRRPNKRKKKISSYNKNVAASLGTLHETFDWEAIAHNFYVPAVADLQPPSRSMVESFTTELAYLMGVLDREESLRSGKPAANPTSLPRNQYHSPFAYSSMPLTAQALGVDRGGGERFPGPSVFPGAGGGQIRRPSPLDRKRTAAGPVPWVVDNWARNKPVASAQGTLNAAPAAAPVRTTYPGSTGENRMQAPNLPPVNSVPGPMPESSVKRRRRGSQVERHEEKGREPVGGPKDKRTFPLVRAASPSRAPLKLSAPLLRTQEEPRQNQHPWRPAIPRSTRTQYANSRPDQGKAHLGTMLPTQQAPAQQDDHVVGGEGKIPTGGAYGGVRTGTRVPNSLPEVHDGDSAHVPNQSWWSQLAAGARAEEGTRQHVPKVEAGVKNHTLVEPEREKQ